jgi:glycosyltransferase involved in cell wall biosynthesis
VELALRELLASGQAREVHYRSPVTGVAYDVRALPYRDGALLVFRDSGAADGEATRPDLFRTLAEQSLAGILVDPSRPDMIAAAILGILGDDAYRERLRVRSIERAAAFSWETTVRRTLAHYLTLMRAAA